MYQLRAGAHLQSDNCRAYLPHMNDHFRSSDADPDPATLAFQRLDPVTLLDAIDDVGFHTDGRISALNSYENRVYAIGLDSGERVIAKFYRPHRWSDESILEEHGFCHALAAAEIPVVAPLISDTGTSLHSTGVFRFCLYPEVQGRPPELDHPPQLQAIGRTIALIHDIGESIDFVHRPEIEAERLGFAAIDDVLDSGYLPEDLQSVYEDLATDLVSEADAQLVDADLSGLSIHGDMHPGNLLWGSDTPLVMDLDDCAYGPAVQDLWMFLSGNRREAQSQLDDLLLGYETFRPFDRRELSAIEPLRALRLVNHAAWIARRWDDPAFRHAFPFFDSDVFWGEHVLHLKEQHAAFYEPRLE